MATNWIVDLADARATLETVGGKAASLARLAQAGFPVPAAYTVTTGAYRRFVAENRLQPAILAALAGADAGRPDTLEVAAQTIHALFVQARIPAEIAHAAARAYAALPGDEPAVAVRSSATAEDLPDASFAGQQQTYLNVRGQAALLDAIRLCWASLWTARAIGYRARQGIGPAEVALAVVVQRLVPADAAGVMFTANPVNGRRDQIVVGASWGLGEAVVSGNVTPDQWIVDKAKMVVVEREIAEKLVQTAYVDGGTATVPVPEAQRRTPALADTQAVELARLGVAIEQQYQMPVDIEWAVQNRQFAVLQARPITALPEPAPTQWQLPEGAYAAMRNNIVELMADPLSPLFATLGLEAVNSSMTRLMDNFLGMQGVLPEEPIIVVNQYAYYNGSIRLGKMLRLLLGIGGIARRMFRGAVERWTETGRPHYVATVAGWQTQAWQERSSEEILAAARELTEAAVDAYGALVSGVIPAAWISEGWFSFVYRFVRRREDPPAATLLLGFDSAPIRSEKALYDLATWAQSEPALAPYFKDLSAATLASHFATAAVPEGLEEAAWREWRARFQDYLARFGHMIYSLDFADAVPRDEPEPALETFLLFVRGEGANPYERQRAAAARREEAVEAIRNRLRGWRLKRFQNSLDRAQEYAPLREDGLADVGLSYPLVRQMLLELGRRLTEAEIIGEPQEIFWLEGDEVAAAAAGTLADRKMSNRIRKRKAVWRAARQAVPPLMLPQLKLFGRDLLELKAGARTQKGDRLKGVAASPGVVTATACVVHGPEEFGKMRTGDILVAPLTTPAWTPLFARASAIVTDVGGPLSHGSIVAREYGIPAVLGTGAATRRVQSGELISVDGSAGLVTLLGAQTNGGRPG